MRGWSGDGGGRSLHWLHVNIAASIPGYVYNLRHGERREREHYEFMIMCAWNNISSMPPLASMPSFLLEGKYRAQFVRRASAVKNAVSKSAAVVPIARIVPRMRIASMR